MEERESPEQVSSAASSGPSARKVLGAERENARRTGTDTLTLECSGHCSVIISANKDRDARHKAVTHDEQSQNAAGTAEQPTSTYVTELDLAELPQLTDATVGSFRLQKELGQRHLLAPEELPHGGRQHRSRRLRASLQPEANEKTTRFGNDREGCANTLQRGALLQHFSSSTPR